MTPISQYNKKPEKILSQNTSSQLFKNIKSAMIGKQEGITSVSPPIQADWRKKVHMSIFDDEFKFESFEEKKLRNI